MTQASLAGRHARLLEELAAAHAAPPFDTTRAGRIARLTHELAETRRALAAGGQDVGDDLFGAAAAAIDQAAHRGVEAGAAPAGRWAGAQIAGDYAGSRAG